MTHHQLGRLGGANHGGLYGLQRQALPGDDHPRLHPTAASNETVADKFREVGFTDVKVSGAGRNRLCKGLWPQQDAIAEIPDEITSISEIEV